MCPQRTQESPVTWVIFPFLNSQYLENLKKTLKENWKLERNQVLLITHSNKNGINMDKKLNLIPDFILRFNLDLEKAEEPEIKVDPLDHRKRKRVPEKHLLLLYWVHQKPLTVWNTTNCGKFFKRWEYQTTWPASWETYMQIRKQQLELDMEQETGSK